MMTRDELLQQFPAQRKRLTASLARLVGAADAEDLAAETLLRALDAVEDFRGDAALATWLHRIGVNLAYDLLRRRERSPIVCGGHGTEVPETVVEALDADRLERQQMSLCVQDLLASLRPAQRHVLTQADMLDWTAPEIARDSGVATGNVKIRLHRARRSMHAILAAHCDFDHDGTGVLCCSPKAER